MTQITLTQPDDWHLHLRDGSGMADVVRHTARVFRRAIVMPNLQPPVVTAEQAGDYRRRIRAALPGGSAFEPLMTLYLTDASSAEEIRRAADTGFVKAVKLYPAGATTNSDSGVTDICKVHDALEAMADANLPLLVHGEVTDDVVDIFDREAEFIDRLLTPLVDRHPRLKVVLEHATTADAVAFVEGARDGVAATITVHHLLMNRNAILVGGIKPHHFCLPVIKREQHRQELVRAAISGNPRFFLGTDSAPHPQTAKESACGCAGIFTAHAALELYAEVFEEADALDRLEPFASFHGPDFYGMPRNTERVTLQRKEWTVPETYPFGQESVVPLRAGETIRWQLVNSR